MECLLAVCAHGPRKTGRCRSVRYIAIQDGPLTPLSRDNRNEWHWCNMRKNLKSLRSLGREVLAKKVFSSHPKASSPSQSLASLRSPPVSPLLSFQLDIFRLLKAFLPMNSPPLRAPSLERVSLATLCSCHPAKCIYSYNIQFIASLSLHHYHHKVIPVHTSAVLGESNAAPHSPILPCRPHLYFLRNVGARRQAGCSKFGYYGDPLPETPRRHWRRRDKMERRGPVYLSSALVNSNWPF